MLKRFFLAFIVLLMTSSFAFALDDQGNPNDPNTNDRANACYEEGSMASKCDTEWEWVCGWHLIQFEYGLTDREEFPSGCISVIPPEILPEPLAIIVPTILTPSGGCISTIFVPTTSINFAGGYFLPSGSNIYGSNVCTGIPSFTTSIDYVFAPAPFDPLALCNLNGVYSSVTLNGARPDVYSCNA